MPVRPRATSSPIAKRFVLAALLGIVVFVVTIIWTFNNDIFNYTSMGVIQEKKNGVLVVDDFEMEAAAPRILLIRAIHNLPFTRVLDIQACVEQVLKGEAHYLNLQRHWILNRLQPPSRNLGITKLLDSYGETYDVLEFDTKFYAHLPYNFGRVRNGTIPLEDPWNQASLRHDKILYSINLFGMRNIQLEYGRVRAEEASSSSNSFDWILPWDFDMILTNDAYQALVNTLAHRRKSTRESTKDYLLIPVQPTNTTPADHALVASTRATWRFDETLRYGQGNWLQSLGVSSENTSPVSQMKINTTGASTPKFGEAVQVLSSVTIPRWTAPFNASDVVVERMDHFLINYINSLDIQTAKDIWKYYPKEQWTMHTDRRALTYERRLWKAAKLWQPKQWRDPMRADLARVVTELESIADSNWKSKIGKWRVASKGEYIPAIDAPNWHDLTRNVTIWALASHVTGHTEYGHYAVKQLKDWFWGGEFSMKPRLKNAKSEDDWYTMLDLTYLLDAVKLLAKDELFTKRQEGLFVQWCVDFKDWLVQQETGGVIHDAILAAVAYFVKDDHLAYLTLALAPRRFLDFKQFLEINRSDLCTDRIFKELHGWHVLARQSQIMGIHLWQVKPWWNGQIKVRIPDDQMYGVDWPQTSALCNITEEIARSCAFTAKLHWSPLWDGLRRFCRHSDTNWIDDMLPTTRFGLPSIYDAKWGIAPFWNLGYRRYL